MGLRLHSIHNPQVTHNTPCSTHLFCPPYTLHFCRCYRPTRSHCASIAPQLHLHDPCSTLSIIVISALRIWMTMAFSLELMPLYFLPLHVVVYQKLSSSCPSSRDRVSVHHSSGLAFAPLTEARRHDGSRSRSTLLVNLTICTKCMSQHQSESGSAESTALSLLLYNIYQPHTDTHRSVAECRNREKYTIMDGREVESCRSL